jgi:hypothetical protein
MTPEPKHRPPDVRRPDVVTTAPHEHRNPDSEAGARRKRELAARSSVRRQGSRPGPLEYALLALVVVGIAITIAMAVVDPSG